MTPLVIGLVLTSAVLHATWNAILRSGADRLLSITAMGIVAVIIALPFAILLPMPAIASWPYIALSATLQIGYCLFLVRAYRHGHLAQVYPIARGTAPLLVTLAAAIFANEQLAPPAILGVVLVSGGIVTLAMGRARPDPASTGAALATGGFIASYMVTDGIGVRLADSPFGYGVWQMIAQGVAMTLVYILIRRAPPVVRWDKAGAQAVIAAILGGLGYCVVIWAMSLSPMGQVSALRETSILFAAVIGVVFLKEPLTARRLLGAAVIAIGAICLSAF